MHRRYLMETAMRQEYIRIEKVKAQYALEFMRWKEIAILKLQTWWRKVVYGGRGRAYCKTQRKRVRWRFRLRQSDDRHVRSKLLYKCKEILGLNVPLRSDSREEIALKSLPFWARQRAREYIWPNKADWGWYVKSRSDPRKGIPPAGFNVGTINELSEQAKLGGWRLPGRVNFNTGSNKIVCSHDWTQFSLEGSFVRIGTGVFVVIKMEGRKVSLDRKAHSSSGEEGLVCYRLPSSLKDRRGLYYLLRYWVYDIADQYTIYQIGLYGYIFSLRGAAAACSLIGRLLSELEDPEGAIVWQQRADSLIARFDHSKTYLRETFEHPGHSVHPEMVDLETNTVNEEGVKEPWIANYEQLQIRLAKEAAMTKEELLLEADLWVEESNAFSRDINYVHKITREMTFELPQPLYLKREQANATKKKLEIRELEEKKRRMVTTLKSKNAS